MIHIVTGAPCSGKSTYIQKHAKKGDLKVDYDLIAQVLGATESHAVDGLVRNAAFGAREGAIKAALKDPDSESWIIHTTPNAEHIRQYEAAGADFITLDPGKDVCLERARRDGRPQRTIDGIEEWYSKKSSGSLNGKQMMKKKIFDLKTNAKNGIIKGYASTWIRKPDSYGDICKRGCFAESIAKIKREGRYIPFLWNHDSGDLRAYIGIVTELREDSHGLYFEATFDDSTEAQKARQLCIDGRVRKFSFAYDVLEQGRVTLEDGTKVNELRKLNIHEISLTMYPANTDTSIVDVKAGCGTCTNASRLKGLEICNQTLRDMLHEEQEKRRKAELMLQAERLLKR